MSSIFLQISNHSDTLSVKNELLKKVTKEYLELEDFRLFLNNFLDEVANTIVILKKIAATNSSINISKEFVFRDLKIVIEANHPNNKTFFEKIKQFLKI